MKFRHNKKIIFVIATVLLLTVAVGTTLAFIVDSTTPVKNTFTSSKVATAVVEGNNAPITGSSFNTGNSKESVKIKNTGDTEAYIRAAVIVTWKSESGTVWAQKPVAGKDYSLDLNIYSDTDSIGVSKWIKGADGFYYWPLPVKSDDEDVENCYTGILVNSCSFIGTAPQEGYSLSVEIVASGIQSKPSSVFNDEWKSSGLVVDDSSSNRALIIKTN